MIKKHYIFSLKRIIIILVISVIWWVSIFSLINKTNKHKVQLFIVGNVVNNNLKSEIINKVNKTIDIRISSVLLNDPFFEALLATQGMLDSDILILPKKILEENNIENQLAILDTTLLTLDKIPSELLFYQKNKKTYGILIYQKDIYHLLEDYVIFDDIFDTEYVIVLNQTKSIKINYSYDFINAILQLNRK